MIKLLIVRALIFNVRVLYLDIADGGGAATVIEQEVDNRPIRKPATHCLSMSCGFRGPSDWI
ncbi:MAG: hypothetical protein NC319_06875 [Butyricicoccus sp.]|nr:hypothetical protein [Butyricicoccus sp.]